MIFFFFFASQSNVICGTYKTFSYWFCPEDRDNWKTTKRRSPALARCRDQVDRVIDWRIAGANGRGKRRKCAYPSLRLPGKRRRSAQNGFEFSVSTPSPYHSPATATPRASDRRHCPGPLHCKVCEEKRRSVPPASFLVTTYPPLY